MCVRAVRVNKQYNLSVNVSSLQGRQFGSAGSHVPPENAYEGNVRTAIVMRETDVIVRELKRPRDGGRRWKT